MLWPAEKHRSWIVDPARFIMRQHEAAAGARRETWSVAEVAALIDETLENLRRQGGPATIAAWAVNLGTTVKALRAAAAGGRIPAGLQDVIECEWDSRQQLYVDPYGVPRLQRRRAARRERAEWREHDRIMAPLLFGERKT